MSVFWRELYLILFYSMMLRARKLRKFFFFYFMSEDEVQHYIAIYRVFHEVLPPVTEYVPDVIWKHFP